MGLRDKHTKYTWLECFVEHEYTSVIGRTMHYVRVMSTKCSTSYEPDIIIETFYGLAPSSKYNWIE